MHPQQDKRQANTRYNQLSKSNIFGIQLHAFHECFHHETFIGEVSSALGPYLNHNRSRIILGLNRNIQRITTIKRQLITQASTQTFQRASSVIPLNYMFKQCAVK